MQKFTTLRNAKTEDEVWFLEHAPVYTRGASCRTFPVDAGSHIPVIQTNRGGKLTYHGPGQLTVYLLLDLKRLNLGPRLLVYKTEQMIIDLLNQYDINANRTTKAPGVYVAKEKIAALGFRISKGYCYHGFSFNVDMDLTPYRWITPCGQEGLVITQLKLWTPKANIKIITEETKKLLKATFS